jgi:hypothetical protein
MYLRDTFNVSRVSERVELLYRKCPNLIFMNTEGLMNPIYFHYSKLSSDELS